MLAWNVTRWIGKVKVKSSLSKHRSRSSDPETLEQASNDAKPLKWASRGCAVQDTLEFSKGPNPKDHGKNGMDPPPVVNHPLAEWLPTFTKKSLMFVVSVVVLYLQLNNRLNESLVYYTNDPLDSRRDGVDYTCGCRLPPSIASTSSTSSTSSINQRRLNLNVCYEVRSLETVTVLMYSNSTAAERIERIIRAAATGNPITRTMRGYHAVQQAHDLIGPINSGTQNLRDFVPLYLDGYRQKDMLAPIQHLQGETFWDFPAAYLRLAFTYTCNNCSICPLEAVNKLFENISMPETWGSCSYDHWDKQCQSSQDQDYHAKCILYPTTSLPTNFAVHRFLEAFLSLPDITFIESAPLWHTTARTNYTSFQPSTMYMNFSHVVPGQVRLTFMEVQKGSALWLSLSSLFPSLAISCSDSVHVQVCNGTSVCNLFTGGDPATPKLNCVDMQNQTTCQQSLADNYVDNANFIWADFGVDSWQELECPNFECFQSDPYLVTYNVSQNMQNDPLNQFLYTRLLERYWARVSGVCSNTYEGVVRYAPDGVYNRTRFLESRCVSNSSTDVKAAFQVGEYCWLTGRYHDLTDGPHEDWKYLGEDLFSDAVAVDRFVCYLVVKRRFSLWFITTIGIWFGWMGVIDRLFAVRGWFVSKIKNKD